MQALGEGTVRMLGRLKKSPFPLLVDSRLVRLEASASQFIPFTCFIRLSIS